MSQKLPSKSILIIVLCAIFCFGAGLGTGVSFAKTYHVSKTGNDSNTGESWEDAFLNIKKATDLSLENDKIWVAEGTYIEGESIEVKQGVSMYGGFDGSEILIDDRDTSENKTIIDGDDSWQCVTNNGILDGFHVTRGGAFKGGGIYNYFGIIKNCIIYSNSSYNGGGIRSLGGSIINCTIYSNSAEANGGGVLCEDGIIADCIIYNNSGGRSCGGGVYLDNGSITNCIVHSNTSYNAGGIFNYDSTSSNCTVYGNTAYSGGGGIYNSGSESKVTDCIVYSNLSSNGGGICNQYSSITNSIVYSNFSYFDGGGIDNFYGKVTNCTVYGNTANDEGGGINNRNGTISNSIIWNNKNGDLYGSLPQIKCSCFGEATDQNGNIKANPLFKNTTGDPSTWDFHLKNGSPCIDNGSSESITLFDIEGNPRPGNDNKVCMGAYESPDEYLPGNPLPSKRLYISKNGDNTNGLSWSTAFTSIKNTIRSINDDDNIFDIWVSEGTYTEGETVIIPKRCSLFGGFRGNETLTDDRDTSNNKTIIDGENSYGCINNSGIIDGFYITKGKSSYYGGGIQNIGTTANCIVYLNFAENDGGGIYNYHGRIVNCTVYSNSSNRYGGGIDNNNGEIINCTLYSNSSTEKGGGVYNIGSIMDCTIYENISEIGGGVYNSGSILNSIVHSNSASINGGGIYTTYSSSAINCIVYKNSAVSGGGIYNGNGSAANCLIYLNTAEEGGGGIYNFKGEIIHCTVCSNSSTQNVDGIHTSNGYIYNSIIWNNNEIDLDLSSNSDVYYSCFREADDTNGNIKNDPLFVNISGESSIWDFRLRYDSPCIDSGKDCTYIIDIDPLDINGVPRPQGAGWDMGAYEFFDAQIGDVNMDTRIDNLDIQMIKDYICGEMGFSTQQIELSDFNTDGKIDIADVVALVEFLRSK
jgi:dockerin type I repeat protein